MAWNQNTPASIRPECQRGKPWKRNLTVTELLCADGALRDGQSYEFVQAFPVRYRFPRLSISERSGNAEEEVEMHLTRIGRELPPNVSGRIHIPDAPVASRSALLIGIDDIAMDTADLKIDGDARNSTANIAVRCGFGPELKAWYDEAAQGKSIRKDITIQLFRDGRPTGQRFNLFECFPLRYEAGDCSPSSTSPVETLQVRIGRIELE